MHGKIYQISRNPIEECEYLEESKYYDTFVGYEAEYVETRTGEERLADIEELKEQLEGIAEYDGIKFRLVNKDKYFEPLYQQFQEELKKLSNISFDQFAGNGRPNESLSCGMYNLKDIVAGYGDYIDDNGEYGGFMALADFMRRMKNGDEFYIGAVFDYKL